MLTISQTFLDTPSWTSLSDLLSPQEHPQWSPPTPMPLQLTQLIEQNRLLKSIKQQIVTNQALKSLQSTDSSICYNEESMHNRSTSNSSKQSSNFKRKINRSFDSKSNSSTNLHRPIRKQPLSVTQYEKILNQIHHLISPHQSSILHNLLWELKQFRTKSKQLKTKEFLLLSQLSQYNSAIITLEQQLKRSEEKVHLTEGSVKKREKEVTGKEKSLARFEMTLFLKEKMVLEQMKMVSVKYGLVCEKEQRMEEEREVVERLYERMGEGKNIGDEVLRKYKLYLGEQRKSLKENEKALEKQHDYLLKLIGEIQTVKLAN